MLGAAPVMDTDSWMANAAYRNRLLIMAHPEGGQKWFGPGGGRFATT
jgi:hypothetical protein